MSNKFDLDLESITEEKGNLEFSEVLDYRQTISKLRSKPEAQPGFSR